MKLLRIHKNEHELTFGMRQLQPSNNKTLNKQGALLFCIQQETKQV